MSNLLQNMLGGRGLSFGHLAKINTPRAGKARGEDDENPPPDDDSGKGKRGKRAADGDDEEEEQQDREDGNAKKGSRAEDDEPEPEDDDNEDGNGQGKKGKRAKADDPEEDENDPEAEDDDDDEEEMRGKSAASRARRRERARCAAIFGSKAAARNPVLAANLAFKTTMTRKQALAVLNETPAPQATYGQRRNPSLGAGGEQGRSHQQEVAASWDRAFAKARR
ncbi:hypothetical protein [Paraburkholderia caballeronis]|uniref:Uncharacterized protein n=1 Tax=Paraburkholderia caballeronis TaxID=416943 RepID=A0A1H7TYL6_9BURK|nr:hypothetical protein [Paraburkholderia caballeronis]PXW23402.1 hypothetical protein C7403_110140 [Paraburkholderia caballeronis]PXW98395.1 hypothetical protein C7407_110140 [Paraburkholderia caballeronis]RAJ95126.1 hypothetical protein C7409_110141 [Paraburkholderia caballeronis]SEC55642.1 hypothetical protein SAMN05445871_2420 [Paraburkholderia caballeronis]SEL89831.1 hypothetical protein SAMN05192542_11730 [Paraburkholderia caballeronis]